MSPRGSHPSRKRCGETHRGSNQKGHQILGYTIMQNHFHFLLYFQKQKQSLNTIIGNGKRYQKARGTKAIFRVDNFTQRRR